MPIQHAIQLRLPLDEHLRTLVRHLVVGHVGLGLTHASSSRACRLDVLLRHALQSKPPPHTKNPGITHTLATSISLQDRLSDTHTPKNKRKKGGAQASSSQTRKKGDLYGSGTVSQDLKTRRTRWRRRRQRSWSGVKPLDGVGRCG